MVYNTFTATKPKNSEELGSGDERVAEVIHYGKAQPDNYAIDVGWFFSPIFGQPRLEAPPSTLRQFANTVWCAAAIKTIIDEITALEWNIVPKEEYEESYDEEKLRNIKTFFDYPNRNGDTLTILLKKLLKDILELDAGVIVKIFKPGSYEKKANYNIRKYKFDKDKAEEYETIEMEPVKDNNIHLCKNAICGRSENLQKKYIKQVASDNVHLDEIFVRDGGSFLVNPDLYGVLPEDGPAYFQYSFYHPTQKPLAFNKREIVYMRMCPRTTSHYGFSPIQSLFSILESLNNAARFNRDYFVENAVPSGVLSLMGASKDSLNRFKANWDKQIRGKPHKLAMFNQEIKWTPMNLNNKDMEWLEGQKFYQKLVWAMYGVTSDELGFTETSNRSVGQSQSRVFNRRAIKPYTQLLEAKFNNEIIPEFFPNGDIEVEFKFDVIDQNEQLLHREENWKDVELGIRTVNEIREELGLEPAEGGDELRTPGAGGGGFPFSFGNQAETEKPEEAEQQEKPKFMSIEEFKKRVNLDLTKEFKGIKEETAYDLFLVKYYNQLEKKVLKIFKEEVGKKDFASFTRLISKYFMTETLAEQLFKFMKNLFAKGVQDAEKELNIDIGVTDGDEPLIRQYVKEQIDGYGFEGGQSWPGIKGLNNKAQTDVIEAIEAGVKEGEGIPDLTKRIQSVFETTKAHATMIARTESNRIVSDATYKGYLKSGYDGEVHWMAKMDNRTSDACKYLNGKSVKLGQDFEWVGNKSQKAWKGQHPPQHPNCFDDKTEVYTEKGWMKFEDLERKDIKIWGLNPDTLEPEWVSYTNFIKQKADKIVEYKGNSFSLGVSENHNQFVYFRKKGNGKGRKDAGKWKLIKDNELPNYDFKFLKGINWKGENKEDITIEDKKYPAEQFFKFMGWYLSEGNITHRKRSPNHYPIKISQENKENIEVILENIDGLTENIKSRQGGVYITDNVLGKYCQQFGHAHEKYIPKEIKEASKELIRYFLDAYNLGDGSIKRGKYWKGYQFDDQKEYFTSSNKMSDDLGELILKVGNVPSYYLQKTKGKEVKFKNGTYTINHDCWVIRETKTKYALRDSLCKEIKEYDGYVYDVELEKYHVLLTRRDGKIVWSGNCRCSTYFKPKRD